MVRRKCQIYDETSLQLLAINIVFAFLRRDRIELNLQILPLSASIIKKFCINSHRNGWPLQQQTSNLSNYYNANGEKPFGLEMDFNKIFLIQLGSRQPSEIVFMWWQDPQYGKTFSLPLKNCFFLREILEQNPFGIFGTRSVSHTQQIPIISFLALFFPLDVYMYTDISISFHVFKIRK